MIWYDYICIRPGVVLWVMNDQYKLGCLPLEKINATFSCHVESWLTMALHPYDLHHPLKVQVSMQWNVRICFGGPRCTVEKLRWFSFPVSIAHKMPRYIQRAIQRYIEIWEKPAGPSASRTPSRHPCGGGAPSCGDFGLGYYQCGSSLCSLTWFLV